MRPLKESKEFRGTVGRNGGGRITQDGAPFDPMAGHGNAKQGYSV
ncbi:MAG: hypothetical protein ACFFCW_41930 [Candidatus Hodarchaeota archaeon]